MPDLHAELEWRGFVQQATPGLPAHLASGRRTVYCGFDPTAPSLQLGNLMPLMLLRHFQLAGHRPIVLMGGGTGLIGDPSGKRSERPLLSKQQIRENLHHQRDQMGRLLDFDTAETRPLVLDNAAWLVKESLIDFLRDVGKHFTVNLMLQKESVHGRMEAGISYTEFSYMLLQAYDFLHLFRERQCTVQVGGSDQWGNITAGVDLIRRVEGAEAHGLVAPLVTTAAGAKFGKSEAGAIWLDAAMTPPSQFYQFWLNTDDRDVEHYLKLFTLRSAAEIQALMGEHARDPAGRAPQRALAYDVTKLAHGESVAEGAVASAISLFGGIKVSVKGAGQGLVWNPHDPTTNVPEKPDTVVDALVQAELARSKSDARRLIEQGGIYLNNERVREVDQTLRPEDWVVDGTKLLLRKGKKTFRWLNVQG